MSRIGKKPIPVPAGVTIAIEPELVRVNGPKGELEERVSREIGVAQENGEIVVTRPTDRGEHRALHGLTRSLVANMVEGVTTGFRKGLEIQGVGYRAQLKGSDLELALGYSHPVKIPAPTGIEFEVPTPTRIVVKGNSKQRVGEKTSAFYFKLSATLAIPAFAQASSFSLPGAPETPTPPIVSVPAFIGTPPPTATTFGTCFNHAFSGFSIPFSTSSEGRPTVRAV